MLFSRKRAEDQRESKGTCAILLELFLEASYLHLRFPGPSKTWASLVQNGAGKLPNGGPAGLLQRVWISSLLTGEEADGVEQ